MQQPPPAAEPFEKTSNVIVGLVLVALMIIAHYASWQFDHKYQADTGLTDYFYYVIDLVYNSLILTNRE